MSENQNTQTENNPQPEVKLTYVQKLEQKAAKLHDRIVSDTAALSEINAELQTLEKLASIKEGTSLSIRVGRGENAKVVNAVVIGVKDDESGKSFKCYYGEGFDADTAVVGTSQIVQVLG